jgi:sec-independent protein translocase protein TatA
MAPSWLQLLVVLLLVVLLFGRGKISEVMGDFATGIKSFKRGLSEDPEETAAERKALEDRPLADRVETRTPPREDVRA